MIDQIVKILNNSETWILIFGIAGAAWRGWKGRQKSEEKKFSESERNRLLQKQNNVLEDLVKTLREERSEDKAELAELRKGQAEESSSPVLIPAASPTAEKGLVS